MYKRKTMSFDIWAGPAKRIFSGLFWSCFFFFLGYEPMCIILCAGYTKFLVLDKTLFRVHLNGMQLKAVANTTQSISTLSLLFRNKFCAFWAKQELLGPLGRSGEKDMTNQAPARCPRELGYNNSKTSQQFLCLTQMCFLHMMEILSL
jgi:hypothetical protein